MRTILILTAALCLSSCGQDCPERKEAVSLRRENTELRELVKQLQANNKKAMKLVMLYKTRAEKCEAKK